MLSPAFCISLVPLRWVSGIEKVVNQIRIHWQDFEYHLRKETQWKAVGKKCHGVNKPSKAVKTRWLSMIDSLAWLMPKLADVKEIVRKYFLKDKNGKQRKTWVKIWRILNKPQIAQYGSFVLTWGENLFKPGLKWIEHGRKVTGNTAGTARRRKEKDGDEVSSSGYRAQEMPERVRKWNRDIDDICNSYADKFRSTIELMGGGEEGKNKCKSMVDTFATRAKELVDEKFGAWLVTPLCLAEMLEVGEAQRVASKLYIKQQLEHHGEAPRGIGKEVWAAISLFVDEHGEDMEKYDVELHDGTKLDLLTWLEAQFLIICIHNADPERCPIHVPVRGAHSPDMPPCISLYEAHTALTCPNASHPPTCH